MASGRPPSQGVLGSKRVTRALNRAGCMHPLCVGLEAAAPIVRPLHRTVDVAQPEPDHGGAWRA